MEKCQRSQVVLDWRVKDLKERYWKLSLLIWQPRQTAIETYATWTLFFHQAGYNLFVVIVNCRDVGAVLEIIRQATTYLRENGLVEAIADGFTQAGGALKATTLGKAIVTSALSIDEGLFVHRELERSMRGFILDDELVSHL